MITLIRWILWPVSLIYQCVVWVRNLCYDKGIFKSTSFDIPTIVVGNLAVGGTGKSPMTEYLINLLSPHYRIATLSRGYGRKTKGFHYVQTDSEALQIGDEPLQFKRKFPHITVAVSEDRCAGIQRIKNSHDLVLLDDAYQHRKLKPGFSILLLEYRSFYKPVLMLPTGDFRDNFSAIRRADLIVITKCPDHITTEHKRHIEQKIKKYNTVPILYTRIAYDTPLDKIGKPIQSDIVGMDILLFCGIANPKPLVAYLESKGNKVHPILYRDHHNFTEKDYNHIKRAYETIPSSNKLLLTSEKDFQRLDIMLFENYPLGYIPIKTTFLDEGDKSFDSTVRNYVRQQHFVNKP